MKNRSSLTSILSVLVLVLFVLLALGSGGDSGIDRGNDGGQPAGPGEEQVAEGSERYQVMYEETVNGLKIIIGEIEVQTDTVLVGVTVKNESSSTLSFYPDQGNVVIGAMQLEANMFMTEGDVSGDIMPGVEKSAVIYFTSPEGKNVPDDRTITLYFGDVFNIDTYEGTEAFTTTINLE